MSVDTGITKLLHSSGVLCVVIPYIAIAESERQLDNYYRHVAPRVEVRVSNIVTAHEACLLPLIQFISITPRR